MNRDPKSKLLTNWVLYKLTPLILSIAFVSTLATFCYGQAQWIGDGDGTNWFLQQNWTSGIPGNQTTDHALFSNEAALLSGSPFVTNTPAASTTDFKGILVRAAIVDIDFAGRSMGVMDDLELGSNSGHSALSAARISMFVAGKVEIGNLGPADLQLGTGASLLVAGAPFRVFDQSSVSIDGASISLIGNSATRTIDSGGSLSLSDNAVLSIGPTPLTNTGDISGNGRILGNVMNSIDGRISVAASDFLELTGFDGGSNFGQVDVISGMLEIDDATTNAFNGLITGRDGIIRFENGLTNEGGVGFSFGTMDVFGDVDNTATGTMVVTGNSEATFYDDIINNGEFRVSPGSTLVVFGGLSGMFGITGMGDVFLEGDLRPGNSPALVNFESDVFLSDNSILEMELGGTLIGDEYDSLDVVGRLDLDGTLNVVLINGFNPANGDSFALINADSLTGDFNDMTLPALDPGLEWNVDRSGQSLVLSVEPIPTLPDSFKLADGVLVSGALADLLASDDQYMVVDPSPTKNLLKQRIDLIVQSSSPTLSPSSLKFRVESAMMGGPSGDVIQTVELFNYVTNTRELVDTRPVSNSDDSIEITPGGDLSRFVNQLNGEITAIVIWKSESFSGGKFSWSIDIDEAVWLISD